MPRKKSLQSEIERAQREVLIQHLRSARSTTLAEAVQMGDGLGKLAGSLTMGELLDGAASSAAKSPRAKGRSSASGRGSKKVETRTQAGREAYDALVLGAIQGASEPIGAEALRPQLGGSPEQLRASLHRLVDAKSIKRKGKARATKYTAR